MNLGDILKKAGSAVISSVVPGGGLIIDLVNGFLDDDDKLPNTATGDQIKNAVDKLPPESRAVLMNKQLDVEINESNNWAAVQGHLAQADASGNTTRPKIALMFAWQIIITCNALLFAVVYSSVSKDSTVIDSITDSWQMVSALVVPMIAVIYQYFGKRTQEKKDRLHAATGQPPIQGVISTLVGKLSK